MPFHAMIVISYPSVTVEPRYLELSREMKNSSRYRGFELSGVPKKTLFYGLLAAKQFSLKDLHKSFLFGALIFVIVRLCDNAAHCGITQITFDQSNKVAGARFRERKYKSLGT